jgi:hypothetical protein
MPSLGSAAEMMQEKSITLIDKAFTIAKRKSEYWDLPDNTLSMLLENQELLLAIQGVFSYVGTLKESNVDRVINRIKTTDCIDYQEWIPQFEGIDTIEGRQSTLLDYMIAFPLHLLLIEGNRMMHALKKGLPKDSLLSVHRFIFTSFLNEIISYFKEGDVLTAIQYREAIELIEKSFGEQVGRFLPEKIKEKIQANAGTQGLVRCLYSVDRELRRMLESGELTQDAAIEISNKNMLLITTLNTLLRDTNYLAAIESHLNDDLFPQAAFDVLMSNRDVSKFIKDSIIKKVTAVTKSCDSRERVGVSFWESPSLSNTDDPKVEGISADDYRA